MPKARIISRDPARAKDSVRSLERSGYHVEVVHPDRIPDSGCDLEINIDEAEAAPVVDSIFGSYAEPESDDREFILAPLWRALMAPWKRRPQATAKDASLPTNSTPPAAEILAPPKAPALDERYLAAEATTPSVFQRGSERWQAVKERGQQRFASWQAEREAERLARQRQREAREAEARLIAERARLATARLEEERARLEAAAALQRAQNAQARSVEAQAATAASVTRRNVFKTLSGAYGKVLRVSGALRDWARTPASDAAPSTRAYIFSQAVPVAAGIVLAFVIGFFVARGDDAQATATSVAATPVVNLATPAAPAIAAKATKASATAPKPVPKRTIISEEDEEYDDIYDDEVIVRHRYPSKGQVARADRQSKVKRYSDLEED